MALAPMSTQPCWTEMGRGSPHMTGSSYGIRCRIDVAAKKKFWWETKCAVFLYL